MSSWFPVRSRTPPSTPPAAIQMSNKEPAALYVNALVSSPRTSHTQERVIPQPGHGAHGLLNTAHTAELVPENHGPARVFRGVDDTSRRDRENAGSKECARPAPPRQLSALQGSHRGP